MIKFKINDKWLEAEKIGIWHDGEAQGVYEASRIQDVQAFDLDYSYKDINQMCIDFAYPESDVQEAMNDYDAAIAPLEYRVSQIEEILRNIILALDIDKQTIIDEQGNDRGQHYVSIKLADLTKKVEKLEHKPQSTVQETPICEHKIDWEQRRYEIAKAVYEHNVYDIGDTALQAIDAADKLINKLKEQ